MMTRGERMLALRRVRMAGSPPLLRGGFRPFFLLGPAWAIIALALWLMAASGRLILPSAFEPLIWHRHEMMFGFVGAVVAGFLLTAIPNWTGRLPIAGAPLAALVALWAVGRLAVLFSGSIGWVPAALLDAGFYVVLAAVAAREVLASKNRNLLMVGIVLLLGVANAADHLGAAGLLQDADIGMRAAIALVVMLISLVGGRVVPSFTRNWMTKHGFERELPTQSGRFDVAVLASSAAALLAWTVAPDSAPSGWLLVVAGTAQALRLSRWSGLKTARDPLVLILHVGYLWLPAGLLLLGASIVGTSVPRSAAIHALTAGAMSTMILAVMTRATLGHTGRELVANPLTTLLYLLVTLGAALRVAVALGLFDYPVGLDVAGVAWASAFLLFLITYGPLLLGPRLGEE